MNDRRRNLKKAYWKLARFSKEEKVLSEKIKKMDEYLAAHGEYLLEIANFKKTMTDDGMILVEKNW